MATHLESLRRELRALLREMRRRGVRRISCFNGGLSPEEYRLNAEVFKLETLIKTEEERIRHGRNDNKRVG